MIYSLISTASNNKKIIENQLFKPVFYHLTDKKDEEDFIKLLNDSSSISVIDEIHSQLEELIKLRNPKLKLKLLNLTCCSILCFIIKNQV